MTKRKALGRGLGALIPMGDGVEGDGGLRQVPVDAIQPNPRQPRIAIDPQSLQELAESIQAHGLIQPLIVSEETDGRFTLIAGERRWRASQIAGLNEVPVVVKEVTPQARLELALVENIQRDDLNPIEEAMAYQHLLEAFGLTQAEAARRVGKSRSEVANKVGLLRLPTAVQAAVSAGQISYGHARALIPLPTPEAQLNLMRVIVKRALSVRQTEAIAQKIKEEEKPRSRQKRRASPEVRALESSFESALGTRVRLHKNARGAGRLVIQFYSDEELQALVEAIVGPR